MKKTVSLLTLVLLLIQILFPVNFGSVYAAPSSDITSQIEVISASIEVQDAEGNILLKDAEGKYTNVPRDANLHIRYDFNLLDENPETAVEYHYSAGDVYKIQLPDELLYSIPSAGKELKIASSDDILGVLKIDSAGLATITFTNYVESHTGMYGWFEIDGKFTDAILDSTITDPFELQFNGEIISIGLVEPDVPNVAVSVAKSGVYDPTTNLITWTVAVTPDGRTSGVSVSDIFSANQTYVDDSMSLNGVLVTPTINAAAHTLNYTIPTSITSLQTIIYSTRPTSTAFSQENGSNETISFTNTARVTRDGTQLAESAATVQTNWITKTGTLDANNKKLIHWSVKVNNLKQTLNGAWINDLLPYGLTPVDGSFYLKSSDNSRVPLTQTGIETLGFYTVTVQSDGKTLIRYLFDQTITDSYTLEFDSLVTDNTIYDSNSSMSYTNSSSMSWATNTSGVPSDTAAVGVVSGNGIISKSVTNNNQNFDLKTNNTQTWTVVLNRNAITINNARFYDEIPSTMEYIPNSFSVSTAGVNGTFTYTAAEASDLVKTGSLEFVFTDPLTTSVALTFKTRLIKFDALYVNGTVGIKNTAYLYGDGIRTGVQSSAATKNVNSQMIAKEIASAYNYQTRRITWQLTVNRNQLVQNNVVLTDVIPAGLKLLPQTFSISTNDEYQLETSIQPESDLVLQDQFVIRFSGELDHKVVVTFQTEVKEGVFLSTGDKTFTNNVNFKSDEILSLNASASQIVRNTIVTKNGNYVTGSDYIDWGVTINPNRAALSDIELVDALQVGLALDTASVKLYTMELLSDGSLVKSLLPVDSSLYRVLYNEDTRVFTFQIPGQSNQVYRLEFTTDVLVERINVNNVITLSGSGSTYNTGSNQISVVVLDDGVSAGGGGVNGVINIRKGSAQNPELSLAGAKYAIYNSFKVKVAESITNEEGIATFTNLGLKTYTIVEIEAPYGYKIDSTPMKVRLTTSASIVQIEQLDQEIRGNLTISKELLDVNGQKITSQHQFSIKLYGPSFPQGELFTISNVEPLLIENLLLGDYYVEELDVKDYLVTISSSVSLTVESSNGFIEITNQQRKTPELPFTAIDQNYYSYFIGMLLLIIGITLKVRSRIKK